MAGFIHGLGRCIVLAFALLGLSGQANAAPAPDIAKGLAWLQSQLQADGSLAGEAGAIATPLQCRAESLATFKLLSSVPSSLVGAITAETEDNTEYLARRAIALSLAGQNADTVLAALVALRNADGGFGGDAGHASNPLDTAWALLALVQNGQGGIASALGARSYLTGAILADGGVDGPGEAERIEASALAVLALQANQSDLAIANIVKNLAAWLLQRQGTDGGWMGESYPSAVAFAAVSPFTADAAIRAAAQGYLAGKQSADGSWGQDPFLTAVVLRALSGQPMLPPASQASLIGQVYDAASGMPLSGASIDLSGPATNSQFAANDGGFTFTGLAAGTYGLQVSNPGYETFAGTYTLNAGQTVDAGKIMLKASANTGVVRGQVTDGVTGQVLAGATVALSGAASLDTVTDAAGQFNIPGVPAGTVTLTASNPGYTAASGSGTIVAGQTVYFQPALYPTSSGGAPTNGQISGQVLALGSGAPLSGVVIEVNGAAAGTTSATGQFDLSLPAASYSVRFRLAGYADATLSTVLTAGAKVSANVSMVPQLSASSIHGVVTDKATGTAIAGAQVQIVGGATTMTGPDGRYAFSGLSGGVFDLRVSATGYASQLAQIRVSQPGDITQNFALSAQTGLALDIGALTPSPAVAGRQTEVRIAATVSNNAGAPASVVLRLRVLNAQGGIVGNAIAYDASATSMLGEVALDAGTQLPVVFRWNTGQFAPGTYTLVAQLVEPGTVSSANPNGQVLLERQGSLSISGDPHFGGSIVANPPVVHANANTPVQISATLQNDGNVALAAGSYTLEIVNVQTSAVIATQQANGNAFAPGELLTLAFADWTPQTAADYKLRVSATGNPVQGSAETTLHVGDAATATFVVDKAVVATGTQKVRGTVHVTGQDAVSATSSDPLLPMIKAAIQKGVTYNDARASNFTLANGCTGCHVQSQALVGGELTRRLTTFDSAQRNIIHNNLTMALQSSGAIGNWSSVTTSSMLGFWALTSVENRADIVHTLMKAANFMIGSQEATGSWVGDSNDSWWAGRVAHTAFNLKSLVETSKLLGEVPSAKAVTYEKAKGPNGERLGSLEGVGIDPAGELYLASYSSGQTVLSRVHPDGQFNLVGPVPVAHIYGIAPLIDGSAYLAVGGGNPNYNNQGLFHRSASGVTTLLNPTPGSGLAMGPDNYLYMSSVWENKIYRISTDGVATEFLSGGPLNGPGMLRFSPEGDLFILNGGSRYFEWLKYKSNGSFETVRTLPYQTRAYLQDAQGELIISPSGITRIGLDGRAQRMTTEDSVWYVSRNIDVPAAKAALEAPARKAVDWLLLDGNIDYANNLSIAHRLMGLGSALTIYQGQPLASTLLSKMQEMDALLRSRQKADGGWSVNTSTAMSDSMVTAQVGVAMDYLNPPGNDPAIRKAVQLLLSRQKADGTWISENGVMYTPLAATTWVIIWLPTALDRLGGIDTDLSLTAPANVSMDNFSLAPTSTQTNANGETSYLWKLPSVKDAGQDVAFDLTLRDMTPGEQRPVAKEAKLTFNNTFTQQPFTAPIDIPKVAASSYLNLQLATDKPQYGANAPVSLTALVTNAGAAPNAGSVGLAIFAADGTLVVDLGTQSFEALAPGAQLPLSGAWNTGTYAVGAYTAVGTVFDAQNRKVGEATAPFSIAVPAGSSLVSARITVDKTTYLPADTVNLSDRIGNLSQNQMLDKLSAVTTVYKPDGGIFWTQSAPLAQLVPAAFKDLTYSVNLAFGPGGVYRAVLSVRDASGAELAQAETAFTVQSTAATGSGLKGTVASTPKETIPGGIVTVNLAVSNLGNADLTNLPLTLSIVDPVASKVAVSWNYSVNIVQGNTFTGTAAWTASGTGKTAYVAVLAATVGGKSITLASDNFTVAEPPVKLDVKHQLLRQGRLLVLLTCKHGERDDDRKESRAGSLKPKSSEHQEHWESDDDDDQTCIDERAQFLDAALTALGIEHAISATLSDFTLSFRSGKYNVYWLSGGAQKLDNDLAQEIREAVNRGDGLLLEGVHDERNGLLDEVAGILYRGKLSTRNQPITLTGPMFTAGTNAPTRGQPLKLALSGGTQQAKFPAGIKCDDCDDDKKSTSGETPAIVSNAYGKGRGMLMAFDLIDSLMRIQPAPLVWQEIMQVSFANLSPQTLAPGETEVLGAGAYAVARTTLANQGQAVALEVTDLLPPGAAVISTSPQATVNPDNTRAKWNLNLGVGQVADLTLALRVPQASGSHTLASEVASLWNGQVKPYGSYPLTLNVASAMELTVTNQLINELKALSFAASRDREARDQAVKALQDAIAKTAQGKNDDAIEKLLDAVDKLRRIGGKDMSTYRLAIDRWLRELELEWLNAKLTVKH